MSRLDATLQRARSDTEFAQSLVRFPVGLPMSAWASWNARRNPEEATWPFDSLLDPLIIAYWLAAAALVIGIYRAPGHRTWRRMLAVIMDNIAVGTCLLAGGALIMPVYAGLLWVTVGYGMRYGPRFLLIAIVAALVTSATVWVANPYWRANPQMATTLILSILIIPTYAFFLHARLRKAQMASETASIAKSRFLMQVSHDLRQPLHAVSLLAGRMEHAGEPAARRDIAGHVERSVHDARELLQVFLDHSIIETGRLIARPASFDLGLLLKELIAANQPVADWSQTRLVCVPTKIWVHADRAFVRTMVQNLLANALRASAGQAVIIGCRRRNGHIGIDIADQGPGLDPAILARIADGQIDAVQLAFPGSGGNGLGLSIVYQLAERAGLAIAVRSVAGRGTQFSIIGLVRAEPETLRLPAPQATPLSGIRVLLVRRDQAARATTAQLLAGWGCVADQADSLPAHLPEQQLILFDLDEPNEAAPLAGWPWHPPLMVLTAHPPDIVRQWLGSPYALIAAKPVTAAELRSLIMSLHVQTR